MFVRYFVELPMPPSEVERALADDPGGWLPGFAEEANHRGELLLAEVGFGEAIRIKRKVTVELGAPVRSSTKVILALHWAAAGHESLFPALDADIEIAPLGAERTQLAMSARYVPPLGALGRALDRALLSRVAEATLKDFLDRVAEAISGSVDHVGGDAHQPTTTSTIGTTIE